MSRLGDVLNAICSQVADAINAAGVTALGQVGVGWPNFEDITKIINAGGWQTTVYVPKGPARNTSRFLSTPGILTAPSTSLEASVSGNVITFLGSVPTSGANVHTLFGSPLVDAYVALTSGQSLNQVAQAVADAITAAGGSATASGAAVTVETNALLCNVGSVGVVAQESGRVCRDVQVVAWCPTPELQESIAGAIEENVGTQAQPRITLPDGSKAWVRYKPGYWSDEREQDFSMYVAYAFFQVEYGTVATFTGTPIGAFDLTVKTPSDTLESVEG